MITHLYSLDYRDSVHSASRLFIICGIPISKAYKYRQVVKTLPKNGLVEIEIIAHRG